MYLPNLYSRNQDFVSCLVGDRLLDVINELARGNIYLYGFLLPCNRASYELFHSGGRSETLNRSYHSRDNKFHFPAYDYVTYVT